MRGPTYRHVPILLSWLAIANCCACAQSTQRSETDGPSLLTTTAFHVRLNWICENEHLDAKYAGALAYKGKDAVIHSTSGNGSWEILDQNDPGVPPYPIKRYLFLITIVKYNPATTRPDHSIVLTVNNETILVEGLIPTPSTDTEMEPQFFPPSFIENAKQRLDILLKALSSPADWPPS